MLALTVLAKSSLASLMVDLPTKHVFQNSLHEEYWDTCLVGSSDMIYSKGDIAAT